MEYDKSKMRELILYIARAQADDPTFGRVKLAKLLYFADNEAFVRLERPITGATYQKLPEGPAAREFVPLRDEMLLNGDARGSSVHLAQRQGESAARGSGPRCVGV